MYTLLTLKPALLRIAQPEPTEFRISELKAGCFSENFPRKEGRKEKVGR
jgi:hypothetical protein